MIEDRQSKTLCLNQSRKELQSRTFESIYATGYIEYLLRKLCKSVLTVDNILSAVVPFKL